MRRFPVSFLEGFLSTQNVSYSPCAESQRELRKHSTKTPVSSVDRGFPPLATCLPLGNFVFPLGFQEGFQ